MRAVNLVPSDQRTGGLSGGRSGGMVYAALAALVAVLLAVSVYALAGRDKAEAEQELASVQTATQQYQAAAAHFAAYEKAAGEATARIAAVKGLADARFDWAGAMRDLSRVVPRNTQVNALSANVRPSIGNPTTQSQLRDSLPTPAITIKGCSATQDTVADLIGRLQAMRRVTQVSLEGSARVETVKADTTADAGAGDTAVAEVTGCTLKGESHYDITVVVFFAPGASQGSAEVTPGDPTAAAGTTPAPTTTTTGN